MLCRDRNETVNDIISECSGLAQKEYKTKNDWEGKEIHWELCKKLQFDDTKKMVYVFIQLHISSIRHEVNL